MPRRTQQEITPSDPFARAAGVFSGRHADKWRKRRTLESEQGGQVFLRSPPARAVPRVSAQSLVSI